jgi:SPP1 gp7 family putative phage head morphogenesis protein
MKKIIELKPVRDTPQYWDEIEKKIIELFRKELYIPLLQTLQLPKTTIKNSIEDLVSALQSGRITFYRGQFNGRFSAEISKELKRLGARWDRKQGSWKIPQSSLPIEIRAAVSASEVKLQAKIADIDSRLAKILPEEIADRLKVSKQFDTTLWKTERDFQSSVKGIKVTAQLTKGERKKVADEWENNMKLWIQEWTEGEIKKLRKDVQASVFTGNRYDTMVKTIQKSYDVSRNKAKFLARQETNLLMAKFKESRYTSSGITKYRWRTVAGSPKHPVRPMHKRLEGTIQSWDHPPIVNDKGDRKNPGEDYNCRCFARPIVEL